METTILKLFRFLAFGVFFAAVGTISFAQSPANSYQSSSLKPELIKGVTVEQKIAGGETHSYPINLAAKDFLDVLVWDGKFDGVISLLDEAGKQLLEVDYTTGRRDVRRVLFIAPAAGKYFVKVRQQEASNQASEYTITLEELRPATAADQANIAAERVFGEASGLAAQSDGDAKKQAVVKYETALTLFRQNGDRWGEARTLIKLGELLASELSDFKTALQYDEQALPIWRELKDRAEEGFTLNEIGFCLNNLGESQKALDFYNQSLAIRREVKDAGGEAITLTNIGAIYSAAGDQTKAIEFYEQSLPLRREVKDTGGEAITLGNIATSYNFLGDPLKAIEFYKQELPLERAVKSLSGEAFALTNMGSTYYSIGERQTALDYVAQALPLARKVGDRWQEAATLNVLGGIYSSLGDLDRALELLTESWRIRHEIGDKRYESVTLTNIGTVYFKQKNYAKALEFYQKSLAVSREIGNPIVESQTLSLIGNAYYSLGDKENALKFQIEAQPIAEKIKNPQSQVNVVHNLGIIYRDAGNWAKAVENFDRALDLNRRRGERIGEAATLYHYAILEKMRGDLDAALKRVEAAIAIVETVRGSVVSQNLRTSYLATTQDYYNLRTEILMRLNAARPAENFAARAFKSAEKSRARSLLDLLKESGADIKQGADAALVAREKNLRQTLAAKAALQTRMLAGKHTAEQEKAIADEIKNLSDEYDETQIEIRRTSPRYAALTQPATVSVKDVQTNLLDAETVLLEYSLGEEKSFLWLVGKDSFAGYELPKRAEIEAAARRFYEILTARNQNPKGETEIARQARIEQTEKQFGEAADDLRRMILAPAAAEIVGKRLLIVADGALQYVPFAALPAASSKFKVQSSKPDVQSLKSNAAGKTPTTAAVEPKYLIETNEIVYLPSASTLAVLRSEKRNAAPIADSVAVVADPVYSASDLRVAESDKTPKKFVAADPQTPAAKSENSNDQKISVERAARDAGLDNFPRLRFSRTEADAISAIALRSNLLEAIDFAANKQTVTSADFGKHRIIHFAAHGLIDSQNPQLSGIVLSLVDERGAAQDGFLRLFEIYNLKLDADLVVLSACRTALGKDVRGEGLVGLTRGFMYAGSPRVAASLWSIDDRATSELMKKFYAAMLREKMPAAKALRRAQIEMLKSARFDSPYYWAAFTLQGDWR